MLLDSSQSTLVSSLGWVDRGALWVLDRQSERIRRVSLGDASYLSLKHGRDDHFAAVHHSDGKRVEISVHRLSAPDRPVARSWRSPAGSGSDGDLQAWQRVPTWYVVLQESSARSGFALASIDGGSGALRIQTLPWYESGYDELYQGIVDVSEVPGTDAVIVSIQRDSHPVIYDPVKRRRIGELQLADRGGNPTCYWRKNALELWVDDYDTLVVVDPATWCPLRSARIQEGTRGALQFMGGFAFSPEETRCVAARPFEGDVVEVDTKTLALLGSVRTGGQPLDVALLSDGSVYARSWKTGELLRGRLDARQGA